MKINSDEVSTEKVVRPPRFSRKSRYLAGISMVAVLATAGGLAAAASSTGTPNSGSVGTPTSVPAGLGVTTNNTPAPADPTYSTAQQQVIYHNQLMLAQCMRSSDFPTFPLPDPSFGNGSTPSPLIGGPNGGNIDVGSQAFQTALSTCTADTHPQAVPSS